MSQEQALQIRDDALELFEIFVESAEPNHWDWQELARRAFDAAEAFNLVFDQRYSTQSATTPDAPPAPSSAEDVATATGPASEA